MNLDNVVVDTLSYNELRRICKEAKDAGLYLGACTAPRAQLEDTVKQLQRPVNITEYLKECDEFELMNMLNIILVAYDGRPAALIHYPTTVMENMILNQLEVWVIDGWVSKDPNIRRPRGFGSKRFRECGEILGYECASHTNFSNQKMLRYLGEIVEYTTSLSPDDPPQLYGEYCDPSLMTLDRLKDALDCRVTKFNEIMVSLNLPYRFVTKVEEMPPVEEHICSCCGFTVP